MGAEAFIVLVVLGLVLGLLMFSAVPADAVLLGALTILMVIPVPAEHGWKLGVLSIKDALAGFSNSGMITVGVLFVVVQGLQATGGMAWIAQALLGRPPASPNALLRLHVSTGVISVLLNNTPVVAMMIPAVSDWSGRLRISPSKLMMPISYAAILGGMCSLIGTST